MVRSCHLTPKPASPTKYFTPASMKPVFIVRLIAFIFLGGALKQMWQSIVNALGGFFGADQTAVDEATGLSVYEKNLIRSSWEQAMKNKKSFGVDVFIRLFKHHPHSQDLFDQFRDVPIEELHENRKMKAHSLRVIASLNSLVENLDDIEILLDMLQNVGRTHIRHHVDKHYYDGLGTALIEAFEYELKDKFNQKTKDAWLKAYGVMTKVIVDEYDEVQTNANESTVDKES